MKKKKYMILLLFILINTSLAVMAKENKTNSNGSISFENKTYFTESDLQYLLEEIEKLKSE